MKKKINRTSGDYVVEAAFIYFFVCIFVKYNSKCKKGKIKFDK